MCACFVPMIGMLPLVAFNRRKTDDPRCPLMTQSGHEVAACLGATCGPISNLKCDILPFARVTLGTRKAYGTAGIHYTSWRRCRYLAGRGARAAAGAADDRIPQ